MFLSCVAAWRRDTPPSARRAAEQAVKQHVLAFRRCLADPRRGARRRFDAALLLGLGSACVDGWARHWRAGRRRAATRGRPKASAAGEVHARAMELLEHLGPAMGTASLLASCPELGRNEAAALLAAYRQACREDHHATVNALQWRRPGTVWALDHTRPPGAVDGLYPHILLVRDLASHFQAGAMPQSRADDESVAAALTDLFTRHGAPLVLKSDNHGAFTGRAVRRVLEKWGVLPLVSPAYLPRYNGSVEAGGGQFKLRAHILATRMDRPGRWTADDVEGARIMANRTLRPWGPEGPTPEERWRKRRRITQGERRELRRDFSARMSHYDRHPTEDGYGAEGGAVFRVEGGGYADGKRTDPATIRATTPLPRWARIWNASPSPGHKRPWEWWLGADPAAADSPGGIPADEAEAKSGEARSAAHPEAKPSSGTPTKVDAKGATDTESPAKSGGQRRRGVVYYKRQERRSLTDVMVARELLVIRKRRIPLPLKRVMRLNIS